MDFLFGLFPYKPVFPNACLSQQKWLEPQCPCAYSSSCLYVRRVTSPTVLSVGRGPSWTRRSERWAVFTDLITLDYKMQFFFLIQVHFIHTAMILKKITSGKLHLMNPTWLLVKISQINVFIWILHKRAELLKHIAFVFRDYLTHNPMINMLCTVIHLFDIHDKQGQ